MYESSRERPYRIRERMRPAPKGDAVTTALTAQVILCALMILCVLLVKKFDAPRYDAFKAQYSLMLSENAEGGGPLLWLTGPDGVFSGSMERAGEAIDGFFSARPAPQSGTESLPDGIELDEPEDPPPDSSSSAEPAAELNYNYLESQSITYVNASGGMFPAVANTDKMTPAPAGCVLSPVYLGSKIKPPVTGVITSEFCYRYHPVTGKSDFHTGMDIAAEEGRAILAALPGEVVEVGYNDTYGNYIVLKHATNLATSYSHCSEIIAKTGMSVRQGERIALVGQTGVATGPHLHFSVIVEDEYTDPAWVLGEYIKLVE